MKSFRSVLVLAACLALFAVAAPTTASAASAGGSPAASAPEAIASKGCSVSRALRRYGPTYTFSLRVSGATCTGGKKLIRAWDNCRRARGGSDGSCPRPGARYRCSERRGSKTRTHYNARVICKKSGREVNFLVQNWYRDGRR